MSEGYPEWADDTFWLALVGMVGGGGAAVLAFCLRSRCRTVECCCLKCERDVLPPDAINVDVREVRRNGAA